MTKLEELAKAKKEAVNLETLVNWKSWLPYLESIGNDYVSGEPRRYYKHTKSPRYFYRIISEAEIHRNK